MGRLLTALLLLALATPASAGEGDAAEEFLLGDVGVRIELPRGWKMSRWSDWDFTAKTNDGVMMFAWATPVQDEVTEDELDLYVTHFIDKATGWGSLTDPQVQAKELGDKDGRPAALIDLGFELESGGNAEVYTSSLPVAGQMFHMATVAGKNKGWKAKKARDTLLAELEVRAVPAPVSSTVEAAGVSTTLPAGWRAPLEVETKQVMLQVGTFIATEDPSYCWFALKARGPLEPAAMVSCQGGLFLGRVDEFSFVKKEEELRPRLFGQAEVAAATPLELPDRMGFLYDPDIGSTPFFMAIIPFDRGLSRTWAIGDEDKTLRAAVESAAQNSTYSGPHPVSLGEEVKYWLGNRPLHPVVLCPGGSCVCFGFVFLAGIVGFVATRKKNKYTKWRLNKPS